MNSLNNAPMTFSNAHPVTFDRILVISAAKAGHSDENGTRSAIHDGVTGSRDQ